MPTAAGARGGTHAAAAGGGPPRPRVGTTDSYRARHRKGSRRRTQHAACKSPISVDCRGFATLQSPRVGKFAAQFVFIEGYAMSVIREADVISGVADAL